MFKRLKLKHTLSIITITLIVISTVSISSILLYYCKNIMMKNSINSLQDSVSYINNSIDGSLSSRIVTNSEIILYDTALSNHLYNEKTGYGEDERKKLVDIYILNSYLNSKNIIGGMYGDLAMLVNANGVAYNLQYPVDTDGSSQVFANEVLSQEPKQKTSIVWYPLQKNIFKPESQDIRQNKVVVASRNLISISNGKYYGKQVFAMEEKSIFDQYCDTTLLDNGYLYIVDESGNLISHSDPDMLTRTQESSQNPYTVLALSNKRDYYIDKENNNVIITQSLNQNHWRTIAVISLSPIYQAIMYSFGCFCFIIFGVIMVAGALIVLLSKHIVAPFEKMIQSMEKVEKGDFTAFVEEKGQYDTVRLIRYYNSMLMKIDNLIFNEYEIKKKKQRAELDALMAQINPHFLYNTLESIVWQARAAGVLKISDMAHYLGKLFNITVNKGMPMLLIESELEHVSLYTKLQNIRYNDKYQLEIEVEDESLKHYKTLKLILQPIVENVILHGFEYKTEDCRINIRVEQKDDMLCYTVEDNGEGIEPEKLKSIQTRLSSSLLEYDEENAKLQQRKGQGIGIINVHQRIQLYYGEPYGVSIESREGHGTKVTICIPIIEE